MGASTNLFDMNIVGRLLKIPKWITCEEKPTSIRKMSTADYLIFIYGPHCVPPKDVNLLVRYK